MSVTEHALEAWVSGLGFGEAPRWHAGALWVSDIARREVLCVDPATGEVRIALATPGEPSGLGWLPDGSLLVVQMDEHDVLRWHAGTLAGFACTTGLHGGKLNDMVIAADGRAWLSNMGFDYEAEPARATVLVGLDPLGHPYTAATDLWCPNGMAIDPAGRRLVVGQSASRDVLEFDIGEDGTLGERRVFGVLPEGACSDGLCMDAAGAVWIASPTSREFLRMAPGGRITDRVPTPGRHAIACVLGGADRRTLFCLTAATLSLRAARGSRDGRIERVQVGIPGAGTP